MSNPKELRKSLRNVVQALLPDLMKSELGLAIRKELAQQMKIELDLAVGQIQGVLKQIDQRSKDVQGYLVRQTLQPSPVAKLGETQDGAAKA